MILGILERFFEMEKIMKSISFYCQLKFNYTRFCEGCKDSFEGKSKEINSFSFEKFCSYYLHGICELFDINFIELFEKS